MNFANVSSLTIPEGNVKAIYCNDVKLWGVGGTYENTITGAPPLTLANCTGDDLGNWSMVGNTVQDGTPSPENPVDVQGVGDWDETEQKYKIPVKTNDTTTNIYLNSPLMQGENLSSDGERDVEWNKVDMSGLTWRWFDSFKSWVTNDITDFIKPQGTENLKGFCTTALCASANTATRTDSYYVFASATSPAVWCKNLSTTEKPTGTLYYAIATPTSETFTPPSIPTQSGTTVIDTDCVVAPSEMTLTFMSTTPQNEETR